MRWISTWKNLLAGQSIMAALWLGMSSPTAEGQVVINEIMADNAAAVENDGNYPDYIELYNASSITTNISNWRLSTNPYFTNNVFYFPSGSYIAPHSFVVVFCDSATNSPGLHTRFGLGRKGDYVGLRDSSGFQRDSVIFGLQVTDFSIGRVADGTGAFQLTKATPWAANQLQTLGLTNKLRINEWSATNHSPDGINSGKDWLELYNPSTNPVSIGGVVFTTTVPPTPPANKSITNLSFIAGDSFLRFDCLGSKDANDNDELDFKLSHNTGETITLYAANRSTTIDSVTFPGNNNSNGWWVVDQSWGRLPDGSTNYMRFTADRTTPGKSNFQPLTNLVVNELVSHTDLPLEDAVEFYNPTTNAIDISRWWLSNDRGDRLKFRIPSNTVVQPFGFKVVYEMQYGTNGFNTNATGQGRCFTYPSAYDGKVVLTAANQNAAGTLTGYELVQDFGPAQNGYAFGRYVASDGHADFVRMPNPSFGTSVTRYSPTNQITVFRTGQGATNPYPLIYPIVVSEIMYHPPDILQIACTNTVCVTNHIDDSTNEFIELFNWTGTNVPLHDPNHNYYDPGYAGGALPYADGYTNVTKLRGTVDFDFPTNVTLKAGGYLLLVNFNPTNIAQSNLFCQKYGVPAGTPVFGPYSGKLSNKKSTLTLKQPDWPQGPSHTEDFGYVPYFEVESISYLDSSPWPTNSDGGGYSLNRVSATSYGNEATNWVDNVPTPGRAAEFKIQVGTPMYQSNSFILSFTSVAYQSYSVVTQRNVTGTVWDKAQSYDAAPTNAVRWFTNPVPAGRTNLFYKVVSPKRP